MTKKTETARTIGNIKKDLLNTIGNKYNGGEKQVDSLLKIHGLDSERLDTIHYMDSLLKNNETLNDVSLDDNANKDALSIEGIMQEALSPYKKLIGYDVLYRKMKELYGKEKAKQLSGEMLDYSIALSDSTNIMRPYCFAVSTARLLYEGKTFGQLKSGPVKRIGSYLAMVNDLTHTLSNHLSGAVATDCMAMIPILSFKDKMYERMGDYYLKNCIQHFVFSLNNLSRSANESPFSSVSIMDIPKLKGAYKDYEYLMGDITEDEYVERAMYIQQVYIDFINEGDVPNDGAPYRFPINVLNITTNKDKELVDEETLDKWCDMDISRFNVFASSTLKLANCCRLQSDVSMLELANQVSSLGGGSSSDVGSHRTAGLNLPRIAFETSNEDEYFELLDSRLEDTILILKAHKELLKELTDKGFQQFVKDGWINLDRSFSTVGFTGILESAKEHDIEVGKVLKFINSRIKELSHKYRIVANLEQLPSESMAVRLAKADKLFFNHGYKVYTNQLCNLWENHSVSKRLKVEGELSSMIDGGSISHINVDGNLTKTQNKKIIKKSVEYGCESFSLTPVYSQCENGHFNKGRYDVCPECAGKIIEQYTKIVGFFVPVSNWSKDRREHDFPNRKVAKFDI